MNSKTVVRQLTTHNSLLTTYNLQLATNTQLLTTLPKQLPVFAYRIKLLVVFGR